MIFYLYVKTHNKTKLKYLGRTEQKNPYKYKGSGRYWINHCKSHGWDISTEIIGTYNTIEELKIAGLHYSQLWNIVESNDWANLVPEHGETPLSNISADQRRINNKNYQDSLTEEKRKLNSEKIKNGIFKNTTKEQRTKNSRKAQQASLLVPRNNTEEGRNAHIKWAKSIPMEVRIRAGKKSAKIITGYKWITNGTISTKVPPTQKLPDGFRYGRMYSRKSSF